jgi:hypothetical protein
MSAVARRALAPDDFGGPRIQLVVHAAGGLLLLVAATALSIYKPWGMTSYGRRQQVAGIPAGASFPVRGITIFLGIAGLVATLLIVHHLVGGALHHH